MIARTLLGSCAVLALTVPFSVSAQGAEGDPPTADTSSNGEIVVRADRLRGQVNTAQAPVLELNEEDIAAYGASSVADLVAAIEPQTGSTRGRGGGRPVFLVNGIRVASFREFRSYPSEAIRKVEVLPEETAQLFGFPPDRRVLNFILKDNFSAVTAEVEYEQPDRGGYSVNEQELTLLRISKAGRLNLNAEVRDVTLLTEEEREIIQTPDSLPDVATDPNPAAFRSLVSDSAQKEVTANWAKAFLDTGSSISLNATYERSDSRSLSGLDSVLLTDGAGNQALRTFGADNPLERRIASDTFSSAFSFSKPLGSFQFTATADANYSASRTEIDRRADVTALIADAAAGTLAIDGALPALEDAGFDVADVGTYSADTKLTVRGSPFFVPAGDVQTTVDLGYGWNRIDSEDSRAGSDVQLTRGAISGGFNIAVPITSTRDDFLAAIGSITLNGQVGFTDLSDFGTLYTWNAGLNWEPVDGLNLQATYVFREAAPSLAQLGNPQITTLNVPFFDLATGDTALVELTTGGNPNLQTETQSDWNFSANWDVPFVDGARLRIDYVKNRSDDVSSSFPFLSPELEAAFPARVTRDAAGSLLAVDQRPIDFFESRTERLSFGLTMRGRIGGGDARGGGRGGPPAGVTGGRRPNARPDTPATDQRAGGGAREGARDGGEERGGPNRSRRGPPLANMSEEQREQFQAFRQRLCADDGEAFITGLAQTLARGETPEGMEGFDSERTQRMLARFSNEDGTLNTERLSRFRERMCAGSGPDGPASAGAQSGRPNAATGGQPRGAGGIPGFGGENSIRYFLNLTHTVELDRQILIAQNGPLLDLLDGDALTAFGTPTNTSRLEAGIFGQGLGMRLSGRYTGSARVNGSGAPGSTDLFVDDLLTMDVRLFADLGRLLKKDSGILKGMRASFRFDNVFDGRRIVRDNNGDIPIGFQPLLVDPTGRYLGMELRKLF
ncbi:hypothetical protein HKD42_02555 [Altererythrobacter sp. RZ02]|uniref:Uncharacterized protein n=1 Tax=Pontixanthobacter rizhaonensis TaxID=2730337 RepID=A0A848QJI7_9SPHN|nr:hypothetical protein [Pontixanthobacter rizhaonensis]NMW30939.1 hypothetical protein [Pontixanthobacter rizhaonensis]